MTIAELVTLAALLAALAVLSWSRAQRLYEQPYGTGLQRVASLSLALSLLSAGLADRAYHEQLPDAFANGIITEATPHHTKRPFPQDYATIQLRLQSGDPLTLSLASCIRCLRPSQNIRVTYDPVSLFIRTVVVLAPAQFDIASIDSRAANGRRLNLWMWAAIVLAYTAFPWRQKAQPHLGGNIARPDRSNSQYGAGG